MDRRDRLLLLLEHWTDIWDPDAGLSDLGGDGSGVRLMPAWCSHPSIVELERGLKQLAGPDRSVILAYYGSETRIVWREVSHKRSNGKRERLTLPQRERILPRGFQETRLAAAITRLETLLRGTLDIPQDLYNALNKPIAA